MHGGQVGSVLIGERSEPSVGSWWIENFISLCISIYGIIYMCRTFITRECTENFTDSTKERK